LKRPDLSEKDRDWLRDREAYNLNNLGQVEELIAHYDRRIAAASGDTRKTLSLLRWKADMLSSHNRPQEVQAAWRAYRAATRPGGEEWLDATQGLARQLRKADQHRAALKLLDEYLKIDKTAGALLDAAESHLALDELERARARLDEAEAAARPLKSSRSELDSKTYAVIQKRLEALRATCSSKQSR
jgi:hypothetical protein